jgi:YD repeat-containing protein
LPEEILPPSPTAFSLGQFGNLAPNLVNGAVSATIPIYTFNSGKLELPISLNYISNGIKVDQTASWVGLGWNLAAGGLITRVIMDEPDERGTPYYPNELALYSEEFGDFLEGYSQYDLKPDAFSFNFNGYSGSFRYDGKGFSIAPYQNIKITSDAGFNWFKVVLPDGIEYKFDIIEYSRNQSSSKMLMNTDNKTAWYCSKIIHPLGDTIYLEYNSPIPYSYWTGLSQTFRKKFKDFYTGIMTEDETYQSITVQARSLKKIWSTRYGKIIFASSRTRQDLQDVRLDSISVFNTNNKFLKKFTFYSSNVNCQGQSYAYGDNSLDYRLFLDSVAEAVSSSSVNRVVHCFEYYDRNKMASRLSYAQDYWGYYNGSTGTDFVPDLYVNIFDGKGRCREPNAVYCLYGLLKKVKYPTGGYSTFDYEPNSYYGTRTVSPPVKNKTIVALGTGTPKTNLDTININFAQEIVVSFNCTYENPTGGSAGPSDKAILEISINEFPEVIATYELKPGDSPMVIKYACTQNTYDFKITCYGLYTFSGITVTYFLQQPYTITGNITSGGMRLLRINDYDGINAAPKIKKYFYNTYAKRNNSSGVKGFDPVYYSQLSQFIPTTCNEEKSHVISSSSLNSIFTFSGDHMNYPNVTESFGENFEAGGKEYEFDIYSDQPGALIFGHNFILGTPLNNDSWRNGKLLKEKIFKVVSSAQVVVSETRNFYGTAEVSEVLGFSVAKDAEGDCGWKDNYCVQCGANREDYIILACIDTTKGGTIIDGPKRSLKACIEQTAINQYRVLPLKGYEFMECTTNHVHTFRDVNPQQFQFTLRFGIMDYRIIHIFPCYYHPGENLCLPTVFEQYSVMEYKFYSKASYLDSTVSLTYDASGANPVTTITKFFYENPVHRLPTKVKSWLSDGSIKEIIPRYTSDYYFDESLGTPTNESSKGVYFLNKRDIINSPVEYIEKSNDKIIKGQIITYNLSNNIVTQDKFYEWFNTPTASYIYLTMNQTAFNKDAAYLERYKYIYDLNANLLEMNKKGDISVSYYWGYNNIYPVVKACNVSNGDLYTKVNLAMQNVSMNSNTWILDPVSEKSKWALFNTKLRQELPSTMITTYTYKPLVGITSETDENGKTTYYIYDEFGRLQYIKDQDLITIQEFKYHYKYQ